MRIGGAISNGRLQMENYKVIPTKSAENDLEGIYLYIATQALMPIAAVKKVKRLKDSIVKKLSFMPQKYRLVNDSYLASIRYRMMNVENYIVFFSVEENKKVVWVERVIHGARDWKRLLPEET